MEWKIGEIRLVNGEWYQCVEGENCEKCVFNKKECYTSIKKLTGKDLSWKDEPVELKEE
mgnify:CR=1 FL=1